MERSKKESNKTFLLVGLGLLAIFIWWRPGGTLGVKRSVFEKEFVIAKEQILLDKQIVKRNARTAYKYTSYDQWGKNPFYLEKEFIKPQKKVVLKKEIKLKGIYVEDSTSKVLLDDKVLGVGEKIEGFTVIEIGTDKVILEGDNKRKEVYLEKF